IDQSTTYQGWDELCQTITAIITAESAGSRELWINTSDFLVAENVIDNADHTATGRIVLDIMKHLGEKCSATFYRDYDIDLLLPNLTAQQVHWKTGLYVAYDLTVQAETGHCTRCESRFYGGWCLRQYARQVKKGHWSSVVGRVWAHMLRHFTRFRR